MLPVENKIDKLAAEIAFSMTGTLTEYLHSSAKTAGWPQNIIDVLSVEFENGKLFVNYPDKVSAIVDDLEYGKPYGLPNPVIYPFIMRSMPYVSSMFADLALDEVIDMEEVF